jgi:hypothetical protein
VLLINLKSIKKTCSFWEPNEIELNTELIGIYGTRYRYMVTAPVKDYRFLHNQFLFISNGCFFFAKYKTLVKTDVH